MATSEPFPSIAQLLCIYTSLFWLSIWGKVTDSHQVPTYLDDSDRDAFEIWTSHDLRDLNTYISDLLLERGYGKPNRAAGESDTPDARKAQVKLEAKATEDFREGVLGYLKNKPSHEWQVPEVVRPLTQQMYPILIDFTKAFARTVYDSDVADHLEILQNRLQMIQATLCDLTRLPWNQALAKSHDCLIKESSSDTWFENWWLACYGPRFQTWPNFTPVTFPKLLQYLRTTRVCADVDEIQVVLALLQMNKWLSQPSAGCLGKWVNPELTIKFAAEEKYLDWLRTLPGLISEC